MRRKLVETGAVDVMINVRGNFFYTRAVPCQLWFFDRAKERDEARRDHVLMLDARNIYRHVSRAIVDFSPEQQKNIAAIVWLYRGQPERFLNLVESYLAKALTKGRAATEPLSTFEEALDKLVDLAKPFATQEREPDPMAETWEEMISSHTTLSDGIKALSNEVVERTTDWEKVESGTMRDNTALHAAREGLHGLAECCRDLTKQVDLAAKLAGQVVNIAVKVLDARHSKLWANTDTIRARKVLEDARAAAIEALRQMPYFVRQADWLQERFPEAKLLDVEGLTKLVSRAEIEERDWSLTPGRYVGVAPEEEDEDFDFEEALRSIHFDLTELNQESTQLAAQITRNFEALGV